MLKFFNYKPLKKIFTFILFYALCYNNAGVALASSNKSYYKSPNNIIISIILFLILFILLALIYCMVKKNKNSLDIGDRPLSNGELIRYYTHNKHKDKKSIKKYMIIGVGGFFDGKSFLINKRALIGKSPKQAHIYFPKKAQGINEVHCELKVVNNQLRLTDLNSSYGTFFENHERLNSNKPYILQDNTKFYLGIEENKFLVKIEE